MDKFIGYYIKYVNQGSNTVYVGRIDLISSNRFVIDDDNYGCDTGSDYIRGDQILDISITREDWHELEETYVNPWADEEIRYDLITAIKDEDLKSIDELLTQLSV